jgi:hypothetical protein
MSPVSPGGLLILLGVGAFLWFFWRDTLAVIDYLRTRERLDRWEREEKQAQAKAQPEAGTEPEPGTEPAPAETSQREE